MRRGTAFLPATFVTLLAASAALAGDSSLPVMELSAGMYRIEAEVARTPAQLQQGLMHRRSMPQHHGMLFLFDAQGTQCMWMRNTFIPLSVAFLRDDGTIVNLADMTPHSEDSHCSDEPVRIALEMNQGWFKKRNIEPGHRIRGLPSVP